jgi:perosamine synthetase
MRDLTKNPYGKYNGMEMKYVLEMLDSESIEDVSWTERLEAEFCRVLSVKYAIACNSGTSGLHTALVAAGVGPGDEVISPALTVVMDAFATIHVGATPVFADVDVTTMNIDPADVARKITPKTKAIISVSLQGLPADMDPIMKLAEKHNLIVVEDSAQTLLGKYKGKIAGTIGHLGVFSFENKKHMTTGSEGGMVVTNDAYLAQRARKFAGIGYKHLTAEAGRTCLGFSEVQDPRFDTLGLNYRMPEVCAAVGLGQLERIHQLVERRQSCAAFFKEAVEGCSWLLRQAVPENYENVYYTFGLRYYGDCEFGISWKEFYNKYIEMGGDGFYGACMIPYLEPVFKTLVVNGVRYRHGLCPVAEETQPRIMQFKTNYRDLGIARGKARILKQLIDEIETHKFRSPSQ